MGDENGYLLIVSDRFYKDLNKLSRQDQVRVRRAPDNLRSHPYKGSKVQGAQTGVYRWRVGSLRIRYDISHRVDGLIVISLSPSDEDVGRWAGADVPVVLIDTSHPALHRVLIVDIAGGYRETQHLIELGHRKIAFIGDPIHMAFNFKSSRYRLQGMRQAMADYGIDFRPDYHLAGEHDPETARLLTHALLALDEPPTAVFAASDSQAVGVLQAAREAWAERAGGSLGDRL